MAEFLNVALPGDCIWTTVAHGDGKATTAPGVKSGWPDIQILRRPEQVFHMKHLGLVQFIGLELKRERLGRVSDKQKICHAEIDAIGGMVYACWTLADVEGALRHEDIPLRASAAKFS